MKRIKCPYCEREVRNVIEADVRVSILYYLNSQHFGRAWGPFYNILQLRRKKRMHKILSLNCRFCGRIYPPKIQKELWKYLKYRKILDDLKD